MIQSKVPVTDHSSFDVDRAAGNREEAIKFNKRGLFIGGAPKSGTTLLMSLLDNHPQLVVLPEETSYLEDRPRYLALKNYQAKLRRLLQKTGLQLLDQGLAGAGSLLRQPGCARVR